MKKAIVVAAVVGVILGTFFFVKSQKTQKFRYETTKVGIGNITNTITATGKIQPLEQVEISTQVSGTIDSIFVDFNDEVKANQIIAVLDKSVLELQVSQSNAALSSAQSEYRYRKNLFERAEILKNKSMISADDYDLIKYNYERSQNTLETAKIDNNRAKTNLSYAIIRSPIDGVVLSRLVEQGQTVAASFNAPTLFTIARDLTKMRVLADVDEADIGQIKEGMNVKFSVDAWADSIFNGVVQTIRVQPKSEANAVTYPVVINTNNQKRLLFPGMTATAEIITSGAEDVLVIPARALRFKPSKNKDVPADNRQSAQNPQNLSPQRSGGGNFGAAAGQMRKRQSSVWVLENGILIEKVIETGERSSSLIEVKSGLKEGDEVILIEVDQSVKKKPAQQSRNPLVRGM
ncbi:MAG: efflux RND transporter periplasmic adaptor subunit [Chitinispirillales bacterium]|jgi:HlyD family secretion protein|nr:efflux RND transporter periplasmic adaptor subunit [Chitinispirillales bacterium]